MAGVEEVKGGVNESIKHLKVTAPALGKVHYAHAEALRPAKIVKEALELAANGLGSIVQKMAESTSNADIASTSSGEALEALKRVGVDSTRTPMATHVEYVNDSSSRYSEAAHLASELVTEADVEYLKGLTERLGQALWWLDQEKGLAEELLRATANATLEGADYRGNL